MTGVRWSLPAPALAGLLGAASAALYLAVPFIGERKWDALMTGAVLARPEWVTPREVLFFAHPLVIPLTAPFAWALGDPLLAAGAREALFGGLVVGLAVWASARLTGSRLAGVLAGAVLTLATSRWQLATSGEEKEVALAFGGAFLLLYLDDRGLLPLVQARAWRERHGLRGVVLAVLLALALAVHLVNGLLVLVVLADVILAGSQRREAARAAGQVLAGAALLAGPFFLWLAIGPGEARTPTQVLAYFLEYHLSGEFVSVPRSPFERLVEAYLGGRAWLFGPRESPLPVLELVLACALCLGLALRALRAAPGPVARLLVWLALLTVHFYFYEPWDPEAWGPAALAWAIVGAAGAGAPGPARKPLLVLGAAGLLVLAGCQAEALRGAREQVAPLTRFAAGGSLSPAPLADVVRWMDARLEPEAWVVVSHRHLASYFHIYTRRMPVVRDYLDQPPEELRTRFLLTTLSLSFYTPPVTSAELREAARAGRPVYLLTFEEEPLEAPFEFGWEGLRLGRWVPPG